MKKINLLAVCGSGTVSSAMVAEKACDFIKSLGYMVSSTEANPSEAISFLENGNYDLVIFTSPIPNAESYGVPVISAINLLTGIGEEDTFDVIKNAIEAL